MKPTTKLKLSFLAVLGACIALICISGCVSGTPLNSNPVTGALYQTQTNYTPQVQVVTNMIPVTVYHTNEVTERVTNQVGIIQYVTNQVPVAATVLQPQTATVTNQVPSYVNTVKPGINADVQTAGGLLNYFFPGTGSIVSTVVTALLGIGGYLTSQKKSSQNYNTAAALVQEVQSIRNFVQTLPNGAAMDTAFTNFMAAHQQDAGVAQKVADLLASEIKNSSAQVAAAQISQAIAALSAAGTSTTIQVPTPSPTIKPG